MVELAKWAVYVIIAIIGFIMIYVLVISGWLPALFGKSSGMLNTPVAHSIVTYLNV